MRALGEVQEVCCGEGCREVSRLPKELMGEELGDYVDVALGELAVSDSYELDFEPVGPEFSVSQFVREMRDGRERVLLGQ
jgi:hypothetical protein